MGGNKRGLSIRRCGRCHNRVTVGWKNRRAIHRLSGDGQVNQIVRLIISLPTGWATQAISEFPRTCPMSKALLDFRHFGAKTHSSSGQQASQHCLCPWGRAGFNEVLGSYETTKFGAGSRSLLSNVIAAPDRVRASGGKGIMSRLYVGAIVVGLLCLGSFGVFAANSSPAGGPIEQVVAAVEPTLVYDNVTNNGGINAAGACPAAQWDETIPFRSGAADDFVLPPSPRCTWSVSQVSWTGRYWGDGPTGGITGFRVLFWSDAQDLPAGSHGRG